MQLQRENTISRQNLLMQYLLIIVTCFFAFFVNNQVIPADIMEARNLATAQEMVRTGNYLIPTMNGELRLEKPPLPTWIAAGIEHITPGNLIVQRYAAGVMGTIMVIFLYLLLGRLTRNRRLGLIGALVLASCFSIVMMGRTATWDIYCHSFMLGAIYFMVLGFENKGPQWKNFILSGTFLGLSFLSKGPVSFYALLLPFLISFIVIYRPSVRGKKGPIITMILICLIVSFWWPLYTYAFHKEMFSHVIQKESSSWLNYNVRPWYYYWKFPAEAGIWALFLVTAIVYFFVTRNHKLRKEYAFFLIWLIASLVLLSIIKEKKSRYLLPILISAAGVVAFYVYLCFKGPNRKWEKFFFRINGIVIALILAAIPFALYFIFYVNGFLSIFLLIISTVLSWGCSAFIVKNLFDRGRIRVMEVFSGVVVSMIIVEAFCLIPAGHLFINEDRHSIRLLRENPKITNLPFFYNTQEELRIELVYEADKTIAPLNISDTTLIYNQLPFVFVSGQSIDSIFNTMQVDIDHIGTFDNNWQKRESKRFNPNLVREVAIISPHKPYE